MLCTISNIYAAEASNNSGLMFVLKARNANDDVKAFKDGKVNWNGFNRSQLTFNKLLFINNNEEVAGQTVFHAHVHLIPRYASDDEFSLNFTEHKLDFETLGKLAEQITKEVEA